MMSLATLAVYDSSSDDDDSQDHQNEGNQRRLRCHPNILLDENTNVQSHLVDISVVDSMVDEEFPLTENAPDLPEVSSLFSSLPAPKNREDDTLAGDGDIEEDLLAQIQPIKDERKKRKIVLPKLSDLRDDDDIVEASSKKKVFKTSTGSGLLKLLPAPATFKVASSSKTALTQLKPHSLGKQIAKSALPTRNHVNKAKLTKELSEDDNDGDSGGQANFFSFDEPKLSDEQLNQLIKTEGIEPIERKQACSPVGPKLLVADDNNDETVDCYELPAVPVQSIAEISEEALMRLRGRRNEKVEMFTIDGSEFQAEARSNLIKNYTVEDSRPSSAAAADDGCGPTRLHKSKHHITHLAFQAKARENDLKNQWAANRMTKRETQKKYGF